MNNKNQKDIKDIGVSIENDLLIKELVEYNFFKDETSVGKFAIALAIKDKKCSPLKNFSGLKTKWASNNFDSDGNLREIVNIVYKESKAEPNKMPYRIIQSLLCQGLEILNKEYLLKTSKEKFNLEKFLTNK